MNESDFKGYLQIAAREREEPFSVSLHARVMEAIEKDKRIKSCQPRFFPLWVRFAAAAVLLLVLGITGWNLHKMSPVQEETAFMPPSVAMEEKNSMELVERFCPWKSTVETTVEIAGVKDTMQVASFDREHLPLPSRQTIKEVWQESADICSMPVTWLLE